MQEKAPTELVGAFLFWETLCTFLALPRKVPKESKAGAAGGDIGFERLFSALTSQNLTPMRQHEGEVTVSPCQKISTSKLLR
ncbi:MAG: hypothetical protein J6K84_01040, partial [Oscillospiraceae bacterium]|nr:hypothetical protein [Oscillospiraceae bacterium]